MASARVLALLVVLACAALAWPVLHIGLAAWQGRQGDVAQALAHWPGDARAAGAIAAQRLQAGDVDAARAAALQALAGAPMDGRAWSVLGLVAAARADEATAVAVMARASEVAPRETLTQAWLLDRAWRAGDAPAFRRHLDDLLRLDPDLIPAISGPLSGLIGTELGLGLRELLAEAPPWRAALWSAWWHQPGRSHVFHAFLASLAVEGRLPRNEALIWSHALERDGHHAEMAWLWAQGTREDGMPPDELLTDGGFRKPPAGYGLGWRLQPVPGVRAVFSPGSGPSPEQSALVLQFAGQRAPFENLQQLMRLTPGDYVLGFDVRADGLRTAHGLQWVVHCLPGWRELAASTPVKGRHGWREGSLAFTVPAEACATQALRLRLRASGPSDQWASGGLRYANLHLRPGG